MFKLGHGNVLYQKNNIIIVFFPCQYFIWKSDFIHLYIMSCAEVMKFFLSC